MRLLIIILVVGLFLVAGCAPQEQVIVEEKPAPPVVEEASVPEAVPEQKVEEKTVVEEAPVAEAEPSTNWMNIGLVDVRTGQTFKISDFKGKPILLESFAVWCPICTQQQKKIKELHEIAGDDVVSISLDTDPNEDAAKVKEAVEERGFGWYFAVSPVELTRALIDQFGVSVVDAPAAPVILICKDQSARLLSRGIKSVNELQEEIAKGC